MKEINAEELKGNLIEMINKKWALVTAGDHEKANTMTVSWGSFGEFWSKPVITIYIRPQRYTKQFIDEQKEFSVCVLPEEYRKALTYCGRTSGKDVAGKFAGAGSPLISVVMFRLSRRQALHSFAEKCAKEILILLPLLILRKEQRYIRIRIITDTISQRLKRYLYRMNIKLIRAFASEKEQSGSAGTAVGCGNCTGI